MIFYPQRTSSFNRDEKNAGLHTFRNSGLDVIVSFVREFLQNALDAILDRDEPVCIKMRLVEIKKAKDKEYLKKIFNDSDSLEMLELSGTEPIDTGKYLVIEEFNTIGLIGTPAFKPKLDEIKDAHWSNFSFGMFRESKEGDAAGRNGVGKIMLNMLSGLNSVIYKTHRSDDDEVWIGGRMEYEKTPTVPDNGNGEVSYENWAWLTSSVPDGDDWNDDDFKTEVFKPTKDPKILKRFDQIFDIEREDGQHGTTWIIPSPVRRKKDKKTGEMRMSEMTDLDEIINAATKEYAWAFFSGHLEIDFDGKKIDQNNIKNELIQSEPDRSEFWEYIDDVVHFDDSNLIHIDKSWQSERVITDEQLTGINLEDLRRAFQDTAQNGMLGFEVPINVYKKTKIGGGRKNKQFLSALRVFLKKPSPDVSIKRESLFVRSNLVLSGENAITKNQKAFCVVQVTNPALSDFCANAENEDHTKLNARKYQLEQKYVRCADTVARIRKSAKSIFEAMESYDEDEFDQMIAEMFGIITPAPTQPPNPPPPTPTPPTPTPPTPTSYESREYFKFDNENEFTLEPGLDKLRPEVCPFDVKIVLKSESIKGVGSLDPSEIGFSKSKVLKTKGCSVTGQGDDYIEIKIDKPDFYLKMDPFSVRFHTKLSYIHDA